jgi:CheY-like chemotaxis protein
MTAPSSDRAGIRQTIRALRKAGYVLDFVDDGGEDVPVRTETEAIETITSVDDAWLHVTHPLEGSSAVRFVMGNQPEEVVCDYGMRLDWVLAPLTDSWQEED